jgi:ribosomal protein S18 acetylase RimI-like enzyme
MTPEPVAATELDAVVRFVTARQQNPEHNVAYLGDDEAGVRADLDGMAQPWSETARVVRDLHRSIVGVVAVEWDEEVDLAWVFGPWVVDEFWHEHADDLLAAALAQRPATIMRDEVSAELANTRLQTLAEQRGWVRSNTHHALVISTDDVRRWAPVTVPNVQPATPDDVAAVRVLHDAEFPNTHTPAERLVTDQTTLVACDDTGTVIGYVAGQVKPDGEGYIDFLGVDPNACRSGLGRLLVTALTRDLARQATRPHVALTVDDERVAARSLYASLGFRTATSFVAYRSR